jgi:hypothetical protein
MLVVLHSYNFNNWTSSEKFDSYCDLYIMYFYIACESCSSFAIVDPLARWSHSNILIKVKSWIRIHIKAKIRTRIRMKLLHTCTYKKRFFCAVHNLKVDGNEK